MVKKKSKRQTAQTLRKREPRASDELVSVYTSSGLLGAEVIKGKLESEGIPAILKYESTASMIPVTVDGLGEVQVLVRAEDERKARRVLK